MLVLVNSLKFLFILSFCLFLVQGVAQRVGVVLSGGGSSGVAHVGVLKALEENNIPIDYITGTSMGALVGGMYAMGFSPAQIEKIILSEEFNKWVFGKPDERYVYYFRERDENSSWIGLNFRVDSVFQTSLPTNIVTPINLDYAFMERTSAISAAAGYNFDSLLIPFRAVAADIYNKQEVVFKSGDVGQAIRASTTYPFYFKPIVVEGKLLFDGGLYNNFPADIMYEAFLPDVIIGSTVATEMSPPDEENIFSQIKNMLMARTSYTEVCETDNMLIVRPKIPAVTILDFSQSEEIMNGGYTSTVELMPRIKNMIDRRSDSLVLAEKRKLFLQKQKPMIIDQININGLNKNQVAYVSGVLGRRKLPEKIEGIRPYYFRLGFDDRIRSIYPMAKLDSATNMFKLNIDMKLDKRLFAQFGGIFSSKPINTGFIALRYKRINRIGLTLDANAYFGKFYSSAQLKGTFDFPFKLPFLIEGDFTLNNYDYFISSSTFFEDVKPSYLIQYDRSLNGNITVPLGNHARLKTGLTATRLFDDYYQTKQFTKADTADRTNFNHGSYWLQIEHNTLNRKFYANTGHRLVVKFRYLTGQEINDPGSTSSQKLLYKEYHDFVRMRVVYDSYFNRRNRFRFGLYGEAVISSQPFFNNYTATLLEAAAFNPIPESRTLFQPNFRAHNFAAAGLKTVTSFTSRLDLRIEGYMFQPHKQILENPDLTAFYGKPFEKRFFMASAVLVYHTPVAPIAVSFNYYDQVKSPFSLIFTVGYLLYNRKAFD